ncbi:hypothetical protein Tco_0469344 [Tanacetum coccineum]
MAPRAVLMKIGLKSFNTARPVNTVRSVNTGRPFSTARNCQHVMWYFGVFGGGDGNVLSGVLMKVSGFKRLGKKPVSENGALKLLEGIRVVISQLAEHTPQLHNDSFAISPSVDNNSMRHWQI